MKLYRFKVLSVGEKRELGTNSIQPYNGSSSVIARDGRDAQDAQKMPAALHSLRPTVSWEGGGATSARGRVGAGPWKVLLQTYSKHYIPSHPLCGRQNPAKM